ncbi:uncharacterized protein C5orf47 homolog [Sturnira hondurensis]|uniref:uncharacterized protein C5orf47 homolog n=1 Tax=Sturnira hondurensis TaxID=192404 RepID=UPI001879C9DE|nr:uncharacterized protein C5orf47 homolog [Sturnira hondurensis]
MAATGGKLGQGQDPVRFVYVTRFGSHRCGGVLQLGGRRAEGRWSPGLQAGGRPEEPRGAAAGTRGGGDLFPGSEPRGPAAFSAARASSERSGGKSSARAGLIQKTLVKKYDFPIPFNEASKITKKKKKVSVWKRVHRLICRMLEENEKYRLRLKGQRLSSEKTRLCVGTFCPREAAAGDAAVCGLLSEGPATLLHEMPRIYPVLPVLRFRV